MLQIKQSPVVWKDLGTDAALTSLQTLWSFYTAIQICFTFKILVMVSLVVFLHCVNSQERPLISTE